MLSRTPLPASSSQQRSASHSTATTPHSFIQSRLQPNHNRSASGPVLPVTAAEQHIAIPFNVSMTESVSDFDVDLEDLRPKKRVRINEDREIVASPQTEDTRENVDAMHAIVPGVALGLPRRDTGPAQRHPQRRRPVGEDRTRKSEGLTPPTMATRLPAPKCVADFSPWSGRHAEDTMNEQVVKNGYSEKAPSPNQNESISARSTVWPTLSSKSSVALQTLSALYSQAMERRQALGRCTASSTFKPPPRVTVTDTKRETWLRDLANPAVPLRRQSRTIPHGIRGKLLLTQCVTKSIPLPRAVWLAKCVGANELRAFRRKGVSGAVAAQGEAKWIRDWTLSVEQFLEEAISAPVQPGWRSRFDYAVKLVAILHTEDLIEREYFMDWTVSGLTSATLERAPFWLLLSKLCWHDICRSGRRGRSLAKALLSCLQAIHDANHTAYTPLKEQLCAQLRAMASQAQVCLVLPDVWHKFRSIIQEICPSTIYDRIRQRTERLLRPDLSSTTSLCSPVVQLYHRLDSIDLSFSIKALTQDCLSLDMDTTTLVHSLIMWASTRYRVGKHRRMIVQLLLIELHKDQHDTDSAILAFLAKSRTPDIRVEDVYAIVAYLARNDSFSSGRFLKWLITSGALSGRSENLAAHYLLAMPSEGLAAHLHNTRSSLLSRLSGSQLATMNQHTSALERRIDECLLQSSDGVSVHSLFREYDSAAIVEVADWLKLRMQPFKGTTMTLHAFCTIRDAFEACCDVGNLVGLIDIALQAEDFVLVASVAETIHSHALELAVMSRLIGLVDRLGGRYRLLRTQHPLEKTSIQALISLYEFVDNRASFVKLLRNDLLLCERHNLSVVCSPASDNLISMQAGNIETDDEVEAVFASGNTMDEQVMHRVFVRIMKRAEKPSSPSPVCRWLSHLRTLEPTTFDGIVAAYTTNQLSSNTETLSPGIYSLIAADCLTIDSLVSQVPTEPVAAMAVLKLLGAPLEDNLGLSSANIYHLQQQRQAFCLGRLDKLNEVVTAASPAFAESKLPWLCDVGLLLCGHHTRSTTSEMCRLILCNTDGSTFAAPLTTDTVISNANALNAHVCASWLSSQDVTTLSDVIQPAILQCIREDSPVWPILLQACGQKVIKSVHDRSLGQLLQTQEAAENANAMAVFTLTSDVLKDNADPAFMNVIAAQLKTVQKTLSNADITASDASHSLDLVRTLLRITVTGDNTHNEVEASKQGRAYTVLALCSLLSTQALASDTVLAEHVMDVANVYIDRLPAELISRLERSARNACMSKMAITACFGRPAQPDKWLALASNALTRSVAKTAGSTLNPSTMVRANPPAPQKPMSRISAAQNVDVKYTPYSIRRWEVMSDASPVIGENDSSISLALFGARKV